MFQSVILCTVSIVVTVSSESTVVFQLQLCGTMTDKNGYGCFGSRPSSCVVKTHQMLNRLVCGRKPLVHGDFCRLVTGSGVAVTRNCVERHRKLRGTPFVVYIRILPLLVVWHHGGNRLKVHFQPPPLHQVFRQEFGSVRCLGLCLGRPCRRPRLSGLMSDHLAMVAASTKR